MVFMPLPKGRKDKETRSQTERKKSSERRHDKIPAPLIAPLDTFRKVLGLLQLRHPLEVRRHGEAGLLVSKEGQVKRSRDWQLALHRLFYAEQRWR